MAAVWRAAATPPWRSARACGPEAERRARSTAILSSRMVCGRTAGPASSNLRPCGSDGAFFTPTSSSSMRGAMAWAERSALMSNPASFMSPPTRRLASISSFWAADTRPERSARVLGRLKAGLWRSGVLMSSVGILGTSCTAIFGITGRASLRKLNVLFSGLACASFSCMMRSTLESTTLRVSGRMSTK